MQYALDKNDVGFIHAGFTDWRKYYNDTGGYDPAVTPSTFNLDRNLYLDNGRAWIDFGLTLAATVLQLCSATSINSGTATGQTSTGAMPTGKNIYPATQAVDEKRTSSSWP